MSEHHEYPPIDNRLLEQVLERFTDFAQIVENYMSKVDDLMNAIKLKEATFRDNETALTTANAKIAELEAAAATAATAAAALAAAPAVLPADAATPEQVQAAIDAVNALGNPAPVA
jgi:DNA repair ATPase RecN